MELTVNSIGLNPSEKASANTQSYGTRCVIATKNLSSIFVNGFAHTMSRIFESVDLSTSLFRVVSSLSSISETVFRNLRLSNTSSQLTKFVDVSNATRIFVFPQTIIAGTFTKLWQERRIAKVASTLFWTACDALSAVFFVRSDLKDRRITLCKGASCTLNTVDSGCLTLAATCSLVDTVYCSVKNRRVRVADCLNVLADGSDITASLLPLARVELPIMTLSLRLLSHTASFVSRLL